MLYETYLYLNPCDQIRFSGLSKDCRNIWDSHFDKSLVNIYKIINKFYEFKHEQTIGDHGCDTNLSVLLFIKNNTNNVENMNMILDRKINKFQHQVHLCKKYNLKYITHAVANENVQCIDEYINDKTMPEHKHIVHVLELIGWYNKTKLAKKYFTSDNLERVNADDLEKCIDNICKNNNAEMLQHVIDVVGVDEMNKTSFGLCDGSRYASKYYKMDIIKTLYDTGYNKKSYLGEYLNAGIYNNDVEFVKSLKLDNLEGAYTFLGNDTCSRVCKKGWYDMIKYLSGEKKIKFHQCGIFEAYKNNHMKIVDYLLKSNLIHVHLHPMKTHEDLEQLLVQEVINNLELSIDQ
jgi:hypothetical protein